MITMMICDDQEIVREGLRTILETDPEITVTATATDGEDLLRKLGDPEPNIVLMDLKMPVLNGVQTIRALRQRNNHSKILVLTTYDEDQWVIDAIRGGASGYLLKDTPRLDLIDAVKGTVMGHTYVDPSIAGKVLAMAANTLEQPTIGDIPKVSPREKKILTLIARGLSNAEAAYELNLSEGTIRNYASALFSRLRVADRTQAAIAALRYGIIKLDEI